MLIESEPHLQARQNWADGIKTGNITTQMMKTVDETDERNWLIHCKCQPNDFESFHYQWTLLLLRSALTRALKGFFLRFKPAFWWTSINRYHGFSRVGLEKILSPFLEHSEEYVGVSAVFAIFCRSIWHRLSSRLRGEIICWVFFGGNSNYRHIYTL